MKTNTTRFRGERLREARKGRGLSQSTLAARIGAHFTSVSDWERGANAPSGRHVASICRELGITTEQLYDEEEDEESAMGDPYVALTVQVRRVADALEARAQEVTA